MHNNKLNAVVQLLQGDMKYLAGLVVLAASLPCIVWADSAAAAAAAAAASDNDGCNDGGAAAAAAASAAASQNDGGSAAAAAAAAASATSPTRKISCNCNLIYDPVCGTDGRTYSNKCVLKCVSDSNVANGGSPIAIYRYGECPRYGCRCPNILAPVCGRDGYTYANKCFLDCENARRKCYGLPPIKIAYPGVCKRSVCVCSDVIIPVCGTDGRTYRNICILQCISRINQSQGKPPIYAQYPGACARETCICPPINDPICGSDGKTYKNRCAFDCYNRRLDQLGVPRITIDFKGVCRNCFCLGYYDPICASNGVTYRNICFFNCENARRAYYGLKPLKIYKYGVCPCYCTKEYKPVCGTDKRTYNNICLLNCENKRLIDMGYKPIGIKYNGPCC